MASVIHPVLLAVPEAVRRLPPPQRAQELSALARRALARSGERLGVPLGPLCKDERGAPMPLSGHFWSLSHKPLFAGAVLAPAPIGLDIEAIRPASPGLRRRTATEREWALLTDGDPEVTFFRYWTAKEAVLKAGGEGFKEWSRCRIRRIVDATRLEVDYRDTLWPVAHFFFHGHIAAIAGSGFRVQWIVEGS